jgi:hypothetical protein
MTRYPKGAVLAASFVGACAYQAALAQDPVAYTPKPRPTITRAIDVVQQLPERIKLGTDMIFKQQGSQRAAMLRRQGFQIRVFPLRQGEKIPAPLQTVDDCEIYVSTVYEIPGSQSMDIPFERLDERWLTVSHTGNTVLDGHYYFVFEASGVTERLFRLHKSDSASYFATGFRLMVEAGDQKSLQKVRALYEQRDQDAAVLYEQVDRKGDAVPCYRYMKLADQAERVQYAADGMLQTCDGTQLSSTG